MTTITQRPITFGYVGATAVVANGDPGVNGFDTKIKITLSQNYNRSLPAGYEAGYPDPNPGAPPKTSFTANPQVIPSGTTFTTWACEANALIALGAASGA